MTTYGGAQRVAYVMSRFPKLTETFVLGEMIAVERLGIEVKLWPLLRERSSLVHDEARPFVARARYLPFLSPAILASLLRALVRQPRALLGIVATVVRHCWGSTNFLFGGLAILPKVVHAAEQMRAIGVTHVHCHFANHPALAGFAIHRLTGIPYSFVAHGSDLHVDRHMLCTKVAEASFVVAISEDNRRVIRDECGDAAVATVEVIHCGVDTERFRPVTPAASDALRILCIGTLHEVKGQTHLIEACAKLHERRRSFRCTFVGDGPDRAALEARTATLGLADFVEFTGQQTANQVLERLHSADVLVAPSVPTASGKREGIPVVLMEAMACGLAVVASDLSGIPELVGDGEGLLVAPGDAVALAAALERLAVDSDLRRQLGASARSKIEAEFDVSVNAARLIERFSR